MPDGWTIKKLDEDDDSVYRIITPNGDRILYTQTPLNTNMWLDNSEHTINEVTLNNGNIAYLFEFESGYTALIWQSDYTYNFSGHHLSSDELIKLANTIN